MSTTLIPGGGREPIHVPDDLPDPVLVRPHPCGVGVQAVWRFPNGRGMSVIDVPQMSYGIEAMLLRFYGEGPEDFHHDPELDEPAGWLTAEQFVYLLREVRDLPPPKPEQPALPA